MLAFIDANHYNYTVLLYGIFKRQAGVVPAQLLQGSACRNQGMNKIKSRKGFFGNI